MVSSVLNSAADFVLRNEYSAKLLGAAALAVLVSISVKFAFDFFSSSVPATRGSVPTSQDSNDYTSQVNHVDLDADKKTAVVSIQFRKKGDESEVVLIDLTITNVTVQAGMKDSIRENVLKMLKQNKLPLASRTIDITDLIDTEEQAKEAQQAKHRQEDGIILQKDDPFSPYRSEQ